MLSRIEGARTLADNSVTIPISRLRSDVAALGVFAVALVWIFALEPIIARSLGAWDVPRWVLVSRGALAILLALVFTCCRLWQANGFIGGLWFRRWWLLWPLWVVVVVQMPDAIGKSAPLEHGRWLLISLLVAFVEEATIRGGSLARSPR
jgi:hypothetical protein